jgi:hypothetical protein
MAEAKQLTVSIKVVLDTSEAERQLAELAALSLPTKPEPEPEPEARREDESAVTVVTTSNFIRFKVYGEDAHEMFQAKADSDDDIYPVGVSLNGSSHTTWFNLKDARGARTALDRAIKLAEEAQ